MLHVTPIGPTFRFSLNCHHEGGIKLAASDWMGTLYILGPQIKGDEVAIWLDTIDDEIECELAPRYHNVEHRKFVGKLEAFSVTEPFGDVPIPDVPEGDYEAFRRQPLFAYSLNGPVTGMRVVQFWDWYDYSESEYDHGKWTYLGLDLGVHLESEIDPDQTVQRIVWVSTYKFVKRFAPDEGCIPRPDEVLEQKTSRVQLYPNQNVYCDIDRTWSEPYLNMYERTKIANRIRRRSDLDIALYQQTLEAELPYSRLIYKAAENVRLLDINMISFIKEQTELIKGGYLKTFFHLEESREFDSVLKSTLSKPKKLRKAVKFIASEYLGMHYGTKLTALDISDMLDADLRMKEMLEATQTMAAQLHHNTVLPRGTEVSTLRRFKAEIQSLTDQDYSIVEGADKFVREFYEIDILPTASNIWDLIPYSFVVDWFVPLGNKLADIENGHYIETLHPRKAFYSTKSIYRTEYDESPSSTEYGLQGFVTVQTYSRECTKGFKDETPCVEDSSGMTVTHGIEAGALIISRFG